MINLYGRKIKNAISHDASQASGVQMQDLLRQNDTVKVINNQIYLYDDIDDRSLLKLKQCLKRVNKKFDTISSQLKMEDFKPTINLHIASNGGCCFTGLHMYDIIKDNKYPVNTYIDGFSASAATFPFLAGNKRTMYQNSYVLIHQLSTLVVGTYQNLKDQMQSCQKIMNSFKKIYLKQLKVEKQELDKLLSKDLWLSREQAVQLGFEK